MTAQKERTGRQAEEAVNILNGHNALDIEERGASYRTGGCTGYSDAAPAYTAEEVTRERDLYRTAPATTTAAMAAPAARVAPANTGTVNTGGGQVRQVVEEELAGGGRQVQRGGARVHTTVTERLVEGRVTLYEKQVAVEHRPVDRG